MNKNIKNIVIIILVLLLMVSFFGFFVVNSTTENYEISFADWLLAACSILSLMATVFLSYVAIVQNDRANKANKELISQNQKLQEINDYQFKIANQEWFPLLYPEDVKLGYESKVGDYMGKEWDKFYEEKNRYIISFRVNYNDNPENEDLSKKYVSMRLAVVLRNLSNSRIAKIFLYKIELCNFNYSHKKYCLLDNGENDNSDFQPLGLSEFVLFKNAVILYDIGIEHKMQSCFNRDSDYILYFKMETITGVKFYESVVLSSYGGRASFSNIKEISEEKL